MILSASTATAFYIGLAVGGVAAAGIGVAVWKWRGSEIEALQLSNLRFQAAMSVATMKAQSEARTAQERVDRLETDLEQAHKRRQETYESLQRAEAVASAAVVALPTELVGMLNNRPRDRPAAPRQDPREILGLTPRAAANPDRSTGGASQLELVRWHNFARKTDGELRELHTFLAGAIKAAPHCFEIIE